MTDNNAASKKLREEIDYLRKKTQVLEHDLAIARSEARKLDLIVREKTSIHETRVAMREVRRPEKV